MTYMPIPMFEKDVSRKGRKGSGAVDGPKVSSSLCDLVALEVVLPH